MLGRCIRQKIQQHVVKRYLHLPVGNAKLVFHTTPGLFHKLVQCKVSALKKDGLYADLFHIITVYKRLVSPKILKFSARKTPAPLKA